MKIIYLCFFFNLHLAFMWSLRWDFGWGQKESSPWSAAPLHGLLLGRNQQSVWLFSSCKNTTKPVYLSCRVSDITTMCFLSLLPPKRGNDGSSFNEDQLIAYLLDLHFAGTDTTANTVLFAILFMMTYPEVQGVYSFICHHLKRDSWLEPTHLHLKLSLIVHLIFCVS